MARKFKFWDVSDPEWPGNASPVTQAVTGIGGVDELSGTGVGDWIATADHTLDWDFATSADADANSLITTTSGTVTWDAGTRDTTEIVTEVSPPWPGTLQPKGLRVNYAAGAGATSPGYIYTFPGAFDDGGGADRPRHIWVRTWLYLAPNYDGWAAKGFFLRTPTGTRTEFKIYQTSLRQQVDNNASWPGSRTGFNNGYGPFRDVEGDRGSWVEILIERKLDSDGLSEGILRGNWAGSVVQNVENIDPDRDDELMTGGVPTAFASASTAVPNAPTVQTYMIWGPVEVYYSDPGWAF